MTESKLFQPITVGDIHLNHRVVLAPLTRFRADLAHLPLPHVKEYYEQRASVPGTLLISEATFIAGKAGGYKNVPGTWNEEQVTAWKKITDAVHAKGSYIFMQLWALGRAGNPKTLEKEDPSYPYVSASNIPLRDRTGLPPPRALTLEEIREYVELYATAAETAVFKAGFDGVEVHGANGYLVDQFLQDVSNKRVDDYGGSIENRSRFGLEVMDAIVNKVGPKKAAIRISPWTTVQDMGMEDSIPTFSYFASTLRARHPDLAYLHVIEPRANGTETVENPDVNQSNDFVREIWKGKRLISAGGFDRESAMQVADQTGDLIAFGRFFISNPDLPFRLKHDYPVEKGDRRLYYRPGSTDPAGYTAYPFYFPDGQPVVSKL